VASARPNLSSLSSSPLRRYNLRQESRQRRDSSARRDLCGGCGGTRIPTATKNAPKNQKPQKPPKTLQKLVEIMRHF
jgi:hypothetical protein